MAGVQHFILAFVQNPNPCRKYATLSVSVISSTVTTKLGDPSAITDSTHLFNTVLNSSCHSGHLKISGSKRILISWARHCWLGRFHHWGTVTLHLCPWSPSTPLLTLGHSALSSHCLSWTLKALWSLQWSDAPVLAVFMSISSKNGQVDKYLTWVYKGHGAKQLASWLKGEESHNELPQLPELGVNRADLITVLERLLQLSSDMNKRAHYSLGVGSAQLSCRGQAFSIVTTTEQQPSPHTKMGISYFLLILIMHAYFGLHMC